MSVRRWASGNPRFLSSEGDPWRRGGWRYQSLDGSSQHQRLPLPTWPDQPRTPNPQSSPAMYQSTGWIWGGFCHRSTWAGSGCGASRSAQIEQRADLCPKCLQPGWTNRPERGLKCGSGTPQWRSGSSGRSLRSRPPSAEGRCKPWSLTGSEKSQNRFPCGSVCSCRCYRGSHVVHGARCAGDGAEGCPPENTHEKEDPHQNHVQVIFIFRVHSTSSLFCKVTAQEGELKERQADTIREPFRIEGKSAGYFSVTFLFGRISLCPFYSFSASI